MQNPLGARKAHTDLLLKRHAFWFAFPSGALMQARQNHISHLKPPLLVRKKKTRWTIKKLNFFSWLTVVTGGNFSCTDSYWRENINAKSCDYRSFHINGIAKLECQKTSQVKREQRTIHRPFKLSLPFVVLKWLNNVLSQSNDYVSSIKCCGQAKQTDCKRM